MKRAGDGVAGVLQAEGASEQRHQGLKQATELRGREGQSHALGMEFGAGISSQRTRVARAQDTAMDSLL